MASTRGLEPVVRGLGEPLLLIHGSHIRDSYIWLVNEPALSPFQTITYTRRGFSGGPPHAGPFSINEQAEDAFDVLQTLGLGRAHVAGHSYGGAIALQMVLSRPERVASLILLEPALLMVPSAPAFFEAVAPAIQRYAAGDPAGAVDLFMGLVGGPNWKSDMARRVPGGAEQAERDGTTFFGVELPALKDWPFDARLGAKIAQPVLYAVGTESGPVFDEGFELCRASIPQTQRLSVNGANHLLQQEPRWSVQIARGIREFLDAHPMSAS